ncbi:hypothetical protein C1646_759103 [Rhizophagus diaphanus]|nr:hypothetical protein C1646_759103 [Rhizophagus diaphanus] [Rhizophagus sp. MUCL 43196]
MEGVELTHPSGSSISAASTSSTIAQPLDINSNVTVGLDASMHAQANNGQSGQETTSLNVKKDDGWTIIKKAQRFNVFILQESLPGDTVVAKKNFAYRKISDVLGLVSLAPTSIKGIKVIRATYESEVQVDTACNRKILDDNDIKIWDVPLDVDKQMLELHLKNLVEETIKDQWSLRFCKYAFRIFPSNLTREERNLRFKYGLKLANLPNSTYAADLKDVMAQVNAKSCFVPKNRFSQNYEKERFAFVFFDNQNDYNEALDKKFSFNNRGLVFVEYNAVTCYVCGSPYHRVRTCPENQRKRNMSSTHEVYQQIYSRYGVKAPKPSIGFKSLFANNRHYEKEMYNWDFAEDVHNLTMQGPSSYADIIKKPSINTVRKLGVPIVPPNSSLNKEKGKQKQQEVNRNPQNQQIINKSPVAISNLEINYINQVESQSNRSIELSFGNNDSTFTNVNNKWAKQFQQNQEEHIERQVIANTQTRTFSPIKADSEAMKTTETDQFIYRPLMSLNESPLSPKPQGENSQRLDNFEARMDQAFGLLTNISGKFDDLMNINKPYVNEDRARDFNNGTTKTPNPQQ